MKLYRHKRKFLLRIKFPLFTFFFFLFFGTFSQISAQSPNKKIDSLENLIKKKRSFENILALSDIYSDSNLSISQKFAKEAIKIAEKENNLKFKGLAYNLLGNILQYKSELDSSLVFTKKSLEFRIKDKDSLGIADSFNNIGIVYDQKAEYKEALEHYFSALKIYEKLKSTDKEAMVASNIGVVYKAQKEYKKSLEYYFLAYRLYQKIKNDFGVTVTSGNIGSTLIYFKKYDEALRYNKQAENGYKKLGLERFIGYPVANSAIIYDSLKNTKLAFDNYLNSITLFERYNNGTEIADISKNFANFLYRQKNFNESITYANKSLEFAQKEDLKLIENDAQLILAKNYAALGKLDLAYEYQRKHIEGKEKIFETEKTKSVLELEKKYQSAKKDKEILQNKNQLYRRNVYIFSLGALFLAGLAVAFSIFRHRKKNEKIKIQKEILHQQDLATKAVMKAEDNERKRMATHLHDGVAQLLGAANMNVEALGDFRDDDTAFDKILGKTKNILDDAITDVRGLSHQMMPNMLIKSSLGNALQDLIEKSNSPKLHINLKLDGLQEDLDKNIQVVIYRIIQECINNTIKHAQASKIDISVKQNTKEVETEISDNGVGFNTNEVSSKSSGLGLENIKSRIDMMKGKFEIESSKNTGTKINVKIPLNQ